MDSMLSKKNFVFSFFFVVFLVGCGGGGKSTPANSSATNVSTSSSGSISSAPSNTAPTLAGILSLDAKAQTTSILVVDVADAENDQVQVSIVNKSDWLTTELNNKQLTITAKPDFFDIKNHSFTISISDGKLSREYPLSVSVVDNSSKWNVEDIAAEDLVGSWEIEDGSRLYIYPNGTGSYITKDNKLSVLKWISSGSSFIDISIPDRSCLNCTIPFTVSSVAKKAGHFRLLINGSLTAVNAKKLSFSSPLDGNYLNLLSLPSGDVYSEISSNGKSLSLRARVEANFFSGSGYSHTIYSLNFSAQKTISDTNSTEFSVTEPITSTVLFSFVNVNTAQREMLTFKAQPTSIKLMPAAARDLVVYVRSKLVLTGDSENKDINDYEPRLATYLNQEQEIYYESLMSNAVAAPAIVAGDKYYLPNASARWDGIKYAAAENGSAATTLVFEESNKGHLLLEGPLFNELGKNSLTWSVTNQTLALNFDNSLNAITYSFVMENGVLYALNNQVKTYAPLVKATNNDALQVPAGFYFANLPFKGEYYMYQYMYLAKSPLMGSQLVITTAKEKSMSSHYKTESDGSITLLLPSSCNLASFVACEDSLKLKISNNETGASLTYLNFKPVAKTGDVYTFVQTRYALTNATSTVFQSLVNLTYDESGANH